MLWGWSALKGGPFLPSPGLFLFVFFNSKSTFWIILKRLFFAPLRPTSSYYHLHSGQELEVNFNSC